MKVKGRVKKENNEGESWNQNDSEKVKIRG